MLRKDATGTPVEYYDEHGLILYRAARQRRFCEQEGKPYLIPEGGICPKCKANILAYSPAVAPWSARHVTRCYWCGFNLETHKAVQEAKSAKSAV